MEFFAVFERFRNEYPTMSAGSLVALGATLGFAFGWIFFRQQGATLKDRNEHLKDALVDKISPALALKALGPAKIGGRQKMAMGFIIVGLLVASFGVIIALIPGSHTVATTPAHPADAAKPADVSNKASRKAELQQFYMAGAQLLRPLPKDMSPEDFKKYQEECDAWLNQTINWIEKNMGDAAKARFLDTGGSLSFSYSAAINEKHNNIIGAIVTYRKNLQTLIVEFDSWNKKG